MNEVWEVWKDIPNYEGLYQISNYGNIKSLPKNRYGSKKEIILKPFFDKDGYKRICLCKDNIRKYIRINVLVAKVFIPNPKKFPIVHHKDSNKINNFVGNLEWTTYQKNAEYGNGKPVQQFELDGTFVGEYPSMSEAARKTKLEYTGICNCCKGKVKSSGGYIWKYAGRGKTLDAIQIK